MNTSDLINTLIKERAEHGDLSVYTTADDGILVAAKEVKVNVMRDSEGDTPYIVIER